MTSQPMGSILFHNILAWHQADGEGCRDPDLFVEVHGKTPWMLDVFTDSESTDKGLMHWLEMREWLVDHFGHEAAPFAGRDGNWHRGAATVHGWTWIGFATQEQMQQFMAAWPDAHRPARSMRDKHDAATAAGGYRETT